eukprot:scaffold18513_cov101-Isochrysis_galbana.AAC.10
MAQEGRWTPARKGPMDWGGQGWGGEHDRPSRTGLGGEAGAGSGTDRVGDLELREEERLAGELLAQRLDVVVIDVRVPDDVHKVAALEAGHVRQQAGEQRVRGDVERHAEAQVSRALEVQVRGWRQARAPNRWGGGGCGWQGKSADEARAPVEASADSLCPPPCLGDWRLPLHFRGVSPAPLIRPARLAGELPVGHVELGKHVAGRQRHFGNVGRVPGGEDDPPVVRLLLDRLDDLAARAEARGARHDAGWWWCADVGRGGGKLGAATGGWRRRRACERTRVWWGGHSER